MRTQCPLNEENFSSGQDTRMDSPESASHSKELNSGISYLNIFAMHRILMYSKNSWRLPYSAELSENLVHSWVQERVLKSCHHQHHQKRFFFFEICTWPTLAFAVMGINFREGKWISPIKTWNVWKSKKDMEDRTLRLKLVCIDH